ncbi:MAG: dihydrolipoyl dehydrogenase [Parasphingorhabdus sp.]|uniref:dihydrolipoyl dehydrogenase n=1 Tax=Parasphingorhabdus sp. TaxID=2709688 RepID=UPI00300281A1
MTDNFDYDVLIIGSGPGGYVAAIRAAQLGLKTACVESRETLGGTCLNVGCIPSKAMLHASELFHEAHSGGLEKFGIKLTGTKLDLNQMLAEKSKAVGELTGGIEGLFKKNKVDWIKGRGAFESANTVKIGDKTVTAKNIVIATGSSVTPLPGVEIDNSKHIVVDSTGALEFPKVPNHLVVIGGGVIGLELGSVWLRLGAKVTVVEYLDQILPGMDGDIRKDSARIFKKQGFDIKTGTKVTGVTVKGKKATLTVEPAKGGDAETIEADAVLVAIGRRPNIDGLALENSGVKTNDRGQIEVGHDFQTPVKGVYAIGDVTPGPMLAHKAEDEGIAVAEFIAGQQGIVNHDLIPGVVYTYPEIASIGKTEEEVKESGVAYKVGKFPFLANSRAKTNRDTEGYVKVIAEADSDRVLGAHIISSLAGTLVSQITQAMEFGATSEDIAYTCHPHPTHSEAIKEAAMAVQGKPIHM